MARRRPDGCGDSDRRVTGGDELDRRRLRSGGEGILSFLRSLLRGGDGSGRRRLSLGDGDCECSAFLLLRGEEEGLSWRRLRGEGERENSLLFRLGGEGERESSLLLRLEESDSSRGFLRRSLGDSLRSRSFLRSLEESAFFFLSGDHSPSDEDGDGECLR